MDRRFFITGLFGGLAAASLGGTALAKSGSAGTVLPAAVPDMAQSSADLDKADAEFAHMPPGPRWRAHRMWHRRHWRRRHWRRPYWRRRYWRRRRW